MTAETSGGSLVPTPGVGTGNHPRKPARKHFRTAWKTRTYGDRLVTGVQLRSHGQSTWVQADELRQVARELDRLADEYASSVDTRRTNERPEG